MARSRAHSDDDDPDVVDVDSIDSREPDVSLATASAAMEVEDALLAEDGVAFSSQQRYVAFQQVVSSGVGFAWLPEAPRGNGAATIVERGHTTPAQEFDAALGLDEIRHGAPRRHVAAAGHGYSLGHQEVAVDRGDGEQYGAYQQVVGGVFGELRDESYEAAESADELEEEAIVIILMMFLTLAATFGTLDWRSLRAPPSENITVRSNFYAILKEQRSPTVYRKTLRCLPESFDVLCSFLEPRYHRKYGLTGKNLQYSFDWGLAVLLTYYGNGCGQDGDGTGGAASQLGMSRPAASRVIKKLEGLLYEMVDSVIYFPAPTADSEWSALVNGFAARGADFPDVACVFDGTLIRTCRPSDHQGFYDKSGKPAYNCLAAIDYRYKFRYIGVFSGSNSDQSMWNQSAVLGARARDL
ncbi:hypothetical protein PR003_g25871 [Phytophthora rubi]|uniref:DDE Tnp4 domain-containing protein n=1 Tax=Phytophthora rubi TaxID=129364 RepID=A0A6A3HII1_9STRA|nr:hypothetical protein PR001_g29180 [Phytophthora rubi]KAE8969127.1 hypothetical protein PR002_g27529 [Phytophthora rubi]KAE9288155.1 hypothetical protein PR003_g25871 [Phytophthora rubi]